MAVGVILLDREPGQGEPPNFLADPSLWDAPPRYAVARGVSGAAALRDPALAAPAISDAVRELHEAGCSLVVGGCGFFWGAWPTLKLSSGGAVVLSALDLLEPALRFTAGEVSVVTYSASAAATMLANHPGRDRITLIGLDSEPTWRSLSSGDHATVPPSVREHLRAEVLALLRHHLTGSETNRAGCLLLECTGLVQFRSEIRSLTRLPIVDVVSFARSLIRS